MNKTIFILFASCILFLFVTGYGQVNDEQLVTVTGFIKNDFIFDTRQNVAVREGHFLLWPSPELLDSAGNDINAKSNFSFLSIESRIAANVKGPLFLGAETSGLLEGDFFGQTDVNINLIRLRHAWIKLKWVRWQILTGQYWNPLFVENCYPATISFNTGAPLQSFARNPQIRIGYQSGSFNFMFAALGQRDYSSYGDKGASSVYLRNAVVPDLHFRTEFDGEQLTGGIGLAYKRIVPRLYSTIDTMVYEVDESVAGITAIAYAKITIENLTMKAQVRYGENITDVLSPGGFGVKDIDSVTGKQTYTPVCNFTVWGEFSLKLDHVDAGAFGGYLKSLGTKDRVLDPSLFTVYGLATNIESFLRISPRVSYTYNKVKCAFEMEYTRVWYGDEFDENYLPLTKKPVSNIRLLTGIYYYF